jgi:hydrogenase nickel incorporation protein HypB
VIKHPFIFMDATAAVINKIDLADAMGVDLKKLGADVAKVSPKTKVVFTNCRTGEGVEEVIEALGLKRSLRKGA